MAGSILSGSSAMLFLGTVLYAGAKSGFAFWDPVLMQIYRYGTLSALLGLVVGALGMGRVRAAIMGMAGYMAIIWS
jgi:hypothetical protein